MLVKVSESEGQVLNYLVAKCQGYFEMEPPMASICNGVVSVHYFEHWKPTSDWAQGGEIIKREKINLWHEDRGNWCASLESSEDFWHTDPLIAAMRCYVTSKLGDEVEVPDELV